LFPILISQCASSRAFSLFLGVLFAGAALGPSLGSLLIRVTHNVLSVFYGAAILHAIYLVMACIVIPESVTRSQMAASQARHIEEIRALKEVREGTVVGLWDRIKRFFRLLSPLGIFLPAHNRGRNPLKGNRRDWNLSLIAVSYSLTVMLMVRPIQN
jgi:MFS family permease